MSRSRLYASSAARQAAYRARCQQARQDALLEKGLPPLPSIATLPGWTRWNATLTAAHALLEQVSQEMQTYFDERTDTWQESERGEQFTERQEAVTNLAEELQSLLR
jgi:hypothetical protein